MYVKLLVPLSLFANSPPCARDQIVSVPRDQANRLVKDGLAKVVVTGPLDSDDDLENLKQKARSLGQNPDWDEIKAMRTLPLSDQDKGLLNAARILASGDPVSTNKSTAAAPSPRLTVPTPGRLRAKVALALASRASRWFRSKETV
jgi:hypothetical protein